MKLTTLTVHVVSSDWMGMAKKLVKWEVDTWLSDKRIFIGVWSLAGDILIELGVF